jgi:hypothetical protein
MALGRAARGADRGAGRQAGLDQGHHARGDKDRARERRCVATGAQAAGADALTGSWTFKEGYTTDYRGGGVVVKLGFTFSNGQTGDDLIGFPNGTPSTVYVGAQGTLAYQRNPQIMQNC